MCGIVGYVGLADRTKNILFEGLKNLEYRGYDSSGICVIDNKKPKVIKCKGKLENLHNKLKEFNINSSIGIGHTRWATHGEPSENNAHPQVSGTISVVHNGIIENFAEIKAELIKKGYQFQSETDTEVIAHLIYDYFKYCDNLEQSISQAFNRLEGSYAVAIISEDEPNKIFATRRFSPLIIGVKENESYLASDILAIIPHTNEVIYLEDNDIAILDKDGIKIKDKSGNEVKRNINIINLDKVIMEKSGYRHFMLKEIYEQPKAISDTLAEKLSEDLKSVNIEGIDEELLKKINRIVIVSCGTSFHASLIGKYMLESISKISTQVELASEFKYREPVIDKNSLFIAISQSGETADTSEALLEAVKLNIPTLGITNVEFSKISRDADFVINTKAGPEIGVASTKAFTTQLLVLYLFSIYLGLLRNKIDSNLSSQLVSDAVSISKLQQKVIGLDEEIKDLSREFHHYNNFIYLGRGINYPIALEGALKLKEISYIHAEGYAAGEMKHGPIALIDQEMPVVFVAPDDIYYKKLLSNFKEVKARGGRVIFISSNEDIADMLDKDDRKIIIPKCSNLISPLITVIPVQFLAYHIANFLGTDIDQPRNLAKVVTVE